MVLILSFPQALATDSERQARVSARGTAVMPFSLSATTHVFTKTSTGGIQEVAVKDPQDHGQVSLVREHLKEIAAQFTGGDFSGPSHIHGPQMPGLAELERSSPGQIAIRY